MNLLSFPLTLLFYFSPAAKQSTTKGVDLETPGLINDASVYEYDLNILNVDDRPWRKPGADITDYFNYGFTEDTWMKYCEKQKYLRQENGVGKIYVSKCVTGFRFDSSKTIGNTFKLYLKQREPNQV